MEGDDIVAECTAKEGASEVVESEFMNELLAQSLREDIVNSTREIRTLILSRAFASTIIEPITRDNPALDALTDTGDNIADVLSPWRPK
jgi:hypothetical protein